MCPQSIFLFVKMNIFLLFSVSCCFEKNKGFFFCKAAMLLYSFWTSRDARRLFLILEDKWRKYSILTSEITTAVEYSAKSCHLAAAARNCTVPFLWHLLLRYRPQQVTLSVNSLCSDCFNDQGAGSFNSIQTHITASSTCSNYKHTAHI